MNDEQKTPENDSELDAPKAFAEDLTVLFGTRVLVPREMDEAILAQARNRLARRRNWRKVAWIAGSAAAATVLLAVGVSALVEPRIRAARSTATALAREDIDRNGEVDILDAFALARHIEASAKPRAGWDVNGDGAVDRQDVDSIARAAVRLDKGAM